MGCSTSRQFSGRHVLITGGSQGLGLHLAILFAQEEARVTIMARTQSILDQAKQTIERAAAQNAPQCEVQAICADVTDRAQLHVQMDFAVRNFGPIDVLITCAGSAPTGYFVNMPHEKFRQAMDLNYFGTLHAVQYVVPSMIERQRGTILLISSGLALTGYVGYSAYCPTKFAVKGLGEALRSELKRHNISVHQAYPPNMDTPGFEVENKTKPMETKIIESGETTYAPEEVAKSLFAGLKSGEYHISGPDFGINMLSRATAGMGPRNSYCGDCCILPITVWVGKVYTWMWDKEATRDKADVQRKYMSLKRK